MQSSSVLFENYDLTLYNESSFFFFMYTYLNFKIILMKNNMKFRISDWSSGDGVMCVAPDPYLQLMI